MRTKRSNTSGLNKAPTRVTSHSFTLTDTEWARYNALRTKLSLPELSRLKAEREIGKKSETMLALLMAQIGDRPL